eukprot:scaffold118871_cov60-Phaeocystis_antarctica.AAC.1
MPARRPDLSWGLLAPSNSSRPAMHAVRMDALGRSVTTGLSAVCASCVCVLLRCWSYLCLVLVWESTLHVFENKSPNRVVVCRVMPFVSARLDG